MRKILSWIFAAILFCGTTATFTSCSSDDDIIKDDIEKFEPIPTTSVITSTKRDDEKKLTIINFNYPSTDPNGNPVMLSASIIIGDEVQPNDADNTDNAAEKAAKGFLIYNHFTVYEASECPTKGDTKFPEMVAGSGLIAVAADYYGFGNTEDKPQAYCMPSTNARASVDALLQAKILLANMGYSWGTALFNIGYSQGAQTAMGVVRLLTEEYPDIKLNYTVAGGGPYDISETYRILLSTEQTEMPSTVIGTVLAYNHFLNMGISCKQMFKEPLLSNVDEWVLSKKYTREQIDKKVATQTVSEFLSDELCDLNTDISKRFINEFQKENLCTGWSPRSNEKIFLLHQKNDATVPIENTKKMVQFLKEKGVNVEFYYNDAIIDKSLGAHENGAIPFAIMAVTKICSELNISPWIDITKVKF